MSAPTQGRIVVEDLAGDDRAAAPSMTQSPAKTFEAIAQRIERKCSKALEQEIPTGVNVKLVQRGAIKRSRVEKFHEALSTDQPSPKSTSTNTSQTSNKAKLAFPTEKYYSELNAIRSKLDLVSSSKLIETYSILERRKSMHAKFKGLEVRTMSLIAELKNRGRLYAVANRLVSGDGLDSNLGRLERDVLWFVAELRYRQMDSGSAATLAE